MYVKYGNAKIIHTLEDKDTVNDMKYWWIEFPYDKEMWKRLNPGYKKHTQKAKL